MILGALETVVSIFAMIGAGVFISWRKWVSEESSKAFTLVIINIAMPSMIIYFLSTNLSREQLFHSWLPLLIVFTVLPLTYLLGRLAAAVFRIPKTRRGVFTALFAFSNSVFIGFPVAYALFGDAGMPLAVFFYLGNTTCFWTLGFYSIRKDADAINGVSTKVSTMDILKKLASPPTITVVLMLALTLAGVSLPSVIVNTTKYLSGLTTPLSLIFMGSMIHSLGRESMKFEKQIMPVLLGRYIIAPALIFAACSVVMAFFSNSFPSVDLTLLRNVFTVQISLPVMAQISIVASNYGADSQFATKSFFWTTLASVVSIPLCMIIFQYI